MAAAAIGAALIDTAGYDLQLDESTPAITPAYKRWLEWFHARFARQRSSKSYASQTDLFDFLRSASGDVVYMDFAWPWRDGRGTEEYGAMLDVVSSVLTQSKREIEVWTKDTILDRVATALDIALEGFPYVILSNQSSNYPTPEVLEPWLADKGYPLICSRRLTMPANDVDNRGLDSMFTEYQYIFGRSDGKSAQS
jgi:hypothetical protein